MTMPVEEENTASILELIAQQVSLPVLLIMVEQARALAQPAEHHGRCRSRAPEDGAGRREILVHDARRGAALHGWLSWMEQHKAARSRPSQTALAGFEKLNRDFAA